MVLLVVDTQKGCFNESLYAFETVRENIKKLITDNEVKENKYIKSLVLEPSIAEINNKTDLHITYEPYNKKDVNGKKHLSSFNFKIDLQNEDSKNDIKINKWGLDELFVLGD